MYSKEQSTDEVIDTQKLFAFVDKPIEVNHGLTERIVSTVDKHWGDKRFPVIHFTNDEVGWGKGLSLTSTNFVKSILSEGLRKNTSLGYIPSKEMSLQIEPRFANKAYVDTTYISEDDAKRSPLKLLQAIDRIRREFVHHGLRTNKNNIRGSFSIPAVVIIDGNIPVQQGDDRTQQAVSLVHTPADKIIGVFQFDPNSIIRDYLSKNGKEPISIRSPKKEKIHFREELSGTDQTVRKDFQRQVLHKVGLGRLVEIKAMRSLAESDLQRQKLVLSAHDMVDIFLISPEEFDKEFPNINPSVKREINQRREEFLSL